MPTKRIYHAMIPNAIKPQNGKNFIHASADSAALRANGICVPAVSSVDWAKYMKRYQHGEWRATIFRDMLLADLRDLGTRRSPTVLDIGCGMGFDDDRDLQQSIAVEAGIYMGIEPDNKIEPGPVFDTVHQCRLEEAPIMAGSIDVAFSVMVLEHLEFPRDFWNKLHAVLRDGGVFWGFTIDSRNWFARLSWLFDKFRCKEWYLDKICGQRGQCGRYDNYPVFYRSNSPKHIERLGCHFGTRELVNFHRIGQLDYYLPKSFRLAGRCMDYCLRVCKLPGSLLVMRLTK